MTRARSLALLAALVLVLAACGDDDASESPGTTEATPTTAAGEASETTVAAGDDGEGTDGDLDPPATYDTGDQGFATLTVGDQTWEFQGVLCAFGEEEIGQEGAEFVLSSLQDGLQLYVSIDSFGHSVSINDIEDFENPSVGFVAGGPIAAVVGGDADIVSVDGNQVTATGLFLDETDEDSFEGVEGTLTATCP